MIMVNLIPAPEIKVLVKLTPQMLADRLMVVDRDRRTFLAAALACRYIPGRHVPISFDLAAEAVILACRAQMDMDTIQAEYDRVRDHG